MDKIIISLIFPAPDVIRFYTGLDLLQMNTI